MVVEGKGSYGIVFSSPRIPILDENYEDIKNLNQVSKLLYCINDKIYFPEKEENIIKTFNNVLKLANDYPEIFMDDKFILPIKGGYIDKNKFVTQFNNNEYIFDWLSKSHDNFNIINQLILHKNEIFQIVYEKGTPINYNFDIFFLKIKDIYNTLVLCEKKGFYFDDLKYSNLIVHNDKIKIIDFEEPINLNLLKNEYEKLILNAKFYNIMYFPYDTFSNLLLYEYTGNIHKIGTLKDNNYYKLLYKNSFEYIENVEYKFKQFNSLINLWDKYLHKHTINLEAYDLELFNSEIFNNKEYDLKYHFDSDNYTKLLNESKTTITVDINSFSESIKIIYMCFLIKQPNYKQNNTYIIETIDLINELFILNKKFIKLTKKTHKDIISFLLSNTNIYSFGFIFLDWLKLNQIKILNLTNKNKILEKIIEIVSYCCINFVIIKNKIYMIDRSYSNIEKIINI